MKAVFAKPRTCRCCGSQLKGRVDKKFCDDYCRGKYNSDFNSNKYAHIRRTNSILRRNRIILKECCEEGTSNTTDRNLLLEKGFDFGYITRMEHTTEGVIYWCYDYAYRSMEDLRIRIYPPLTPGDDHRVQTN